MTPNGQALVLRNALLLVLGQAVAMPLSVLVNAVMGRYLGAEEFGYYYLASTFVAFGVLFVEWGQSGTMPALVARERLRAGEYLGSALAWRVLTVPLVYAVLAVLFVALGYSRHLQLALALLSLNSLIVAVTGACHETVRGFERTDIAAYTAVAQQLLMAVLMVPVLLLGGRLPSVLLVFATVSALLLVFVARMLGPVGVHGLRVSVPTVRLLLKQGWPFLLFSLTMALQPNIDAVFLSKLAPPEVTGWHAAARRLVGVLVYPAGALISALYPTLCRLHAEAPAAFRDTARAAVRNSALLVAPLALGTALYADLGVRIFGSQGFGPAIDNLRLYALFIPLVYLSMPLGSALLAAGRQREWAAAQFVCVLVSVVLDPLLVPLFQARAGNGGLGICVATLSSEVLMVAAALWLTPRGVVDRSLVRGLAPVLAGALAMAGVAWLLGGLPSLVASPLAVLSYFGVLWLTGGLDRHQLDAVKGFLSRKAARS